MGSVAIVSAPMDRKLSEPKRKSLSGLSSTHNNLHRELRRIVFKKEPQN